MRDFLVRLDVPQCADLKGVVVNGIRFVAVINITEITMHQKTLLAVEPEDIVAIPGRVLSGEGSDDFTCRYKGIGEQALAMDGAVIDINSIIGHLTSSFVLTDVDSTLRALDMSGERVTRRRFPGVDAWLHVLARVLCAMLNGRVA
jgi:hypothetical protein